MTINLADQWTETTVGNIVESAIFYGKVRLVTPISRLTQLLAQGPQTISLLSRLIDDGHLEIEIEQFPAGELGPVDKVDSQISGSVIQDFLLGGGFGARRPDGYGMADHRGAIAH